MRSFPLMRASSIRTNMLSAIAGVSFAMLAASAHAALTISTDATNSVTCAGGVCKATAKDAALNVADLGTMLAAGNVTIKSGSKAQDIVVAAPFSWTSSDGLTLDAFHSIRVQKPVSDSGPGALTLTTNDGGTGGNLFFIDKGKVTFLSTSNTLTINDHVYTLEDSLPALASAAGNNPLGFYALANSYDAKADGVYAKTPIATLGGTLEGLGNAISNFSLRSDTKNALTALIGWNTGTITNLTLDKASIKEGGNRATIGGLAGVNRGTLSGDHVTGKIEGGDRAQMGGLVGFSDHVIIRSSSSASVSGRKQADVGGLIGVAGGGTISQSYAAGTVSERFGFAFDGGFIGANDGAVMSDVYATGAISAGKTSWIGGFAGVDSPGAITSSYSTGTVSGDSDGGIVGGYTGGGSATLADCYWDIDASGTDQGTGFGNVPGLTGLKTKQFKSGLPAGFDPTVWAQDKKINNGYPYLIDNPPAK